MDILKSMMPATPEGKMPSALLKQQNPPNNGLQVSKQNSDVGDVYTDNLNSSRALGVQADEFLGLDVDVDIKLNQGSFDELNTNVNVTIRYEGDDSDNINIDIGVNVEYITGAPAKETAFDNMLQLSPDILEMQLQVLLLNPNSQEFGGNNFMNSLMGLNSSASTDVLKDVLNVDVNVEITLPESMRPEAGSTTSYEVSVGVSAYSRVDSMSSESLDMVA